MESEEDEEAIIEKRRQQRLAIVQKYETISTATSSKAASVASSAQSDSDSDSSSDEDSDAVDRRATKDLEEDIELVASHSGRGVITATVMAKPSKEVGTPQIRRDGKLQDSKPVAEDTHKETSSTNNGDMFAEGDMFSENYSVSKILAVSCKHCVSLSGLFSLKTWV